MNSHLRILDQQAALAFAVTQATHIEATVNRTMYPEIVYPTVIPIDTSANPFVQSVMYYSADIFGRARWINGNADDIPVAGTERAAAVTGVHTAAIGYVFGWEEINYANLVGQNIQADDAAAARRASEQMIEDVAFTGSAEKGFMGLTNYTGVPTAAAPVGNWTTASTAANIIGDLNALITGVSSGTNYTSYADTILLPPEKLSLLGAIIVPDTGMPLLSWYQQNNAYSALSAQTPIIRAISQLSGTGKAIAYRRSPDVLKMHIPMPHRFLPVYQDGPLHYVVPGVFRLGGLEIRRKEEVRYQTGL